MASGQVWYTSGVGIGDILRKSAGLDGPDLTTSSVSIGDPALADFLGMAPMSASGQAVSERTALGLTAFYRAVSLISGTLAALPWKTYRSTAGGERERTDSWLDDPGAPMGLTPYSWRELVYAHLTMWGNAYGWQIRTRAGLQGIQWLHPRSVRVEQDPKTLQKTFLVSMADGTQQRFTAVQVLHIPGLSTDGVIGISPLTVARNAIGSGLAADEAAGKMFRKGLMLGGMVSSDSQLDKEQARGVKEAFERKLGGSAHAGELLVTNANLKFSPWQSTAQDAQFIESRAFQVEEIARFYGLPKVLLAEDGASTWGSGIAELVRGLEKFTFRPWAARVEHALTTLLPEGEFLELDFAGLLAPSETEATNNLIAEVQAGLLTIDEARRIKNRPPAPTPAPQEAPA